MAARPGGARPAASVKADLKLWAPWRHSYIESSAKGPKRACIFCLKTLAAAERRRKLVLYLGPCALVMLNRYPYNNGHLMIAPRRHLGSPELLSREERALLGELIAESVKRLRSVLSPDGFNLGANVGRSAGAGFAGHLHYHVVPRWTGDNNFMPVLSSTRVLSEHLEHSFKKLAPVFKSIGRDLS